MHESLLPGQLDYRGRKSKAGLVLDCLPPAFPALISYAVLAPISYCAWQRGTRTRMRSIHCMSSVYGPLHGVMSASSACI